MGGSKVGQSRWAGRDAARLTASLPPCLVVSSPHYTTRLTSLLLFSSLLLRACGDSYHTCHLPLSALATAVGAFCQAAWPAALPPSATARRMSGIPLIRRAGRQQRQASFPPHNRLITARRSCAVTAAAVAAATDNGSSMPIPSAKRPCISPHHLFSHFSSSPPPPRLTTSATGTHSSLVHQHDMEEVCRGRVARQTNTA